MTTPIENAADGGALSGTAAESEFAVQLKLGLGEERRIKLARGSSILGILEIVAPECGGQVDDFIIVREGEMTEIALNVIVDELYPRHRRHHVHHKSLVEVVVYYGGKETRRAFRRRENVESVLNWATGVKEFQIDAGTAAEFELARHGHREELPGTEHIGHVAGRETELKLDLVRGDIANGRSCDA